MAETYRARDDFERNDLSALIKQIGVLAQALGKLVPSDLAARTAGATQEQGAAAAATNPNETDDSGSKPSRSRRRPPPEQSMSPSELARMMGVHMGGPGARQQPPLLQPSPPVSYSITPRRFRHDIQSEDDIIDVTPQAKLPSPPRGLPSPSSNLPAPIGQSPADMALTPGKLDRIAGQFIQSVIDVLDARQRTWAATSGASLGKAGQAPGQGGPWGPFQATNYRTYAGGGAAGGGGGGGRGRSGNGTGGRGRNPFGGGAWNWFRRTASNGGANAASWAWGRYGRRARAGAYKATKGAASFFGAAGSAAGMVGKAAGVAGIAVGAVKEIYDVTQSLKKYSEDTFQQGRRLSAYSGDIATTFAMTDVQENFRNRRLAAGTADTYKSLGGMVNLNRNLQVNQDVFTTNLQNRAGIAAGGLASGAQLMFSEIFKGLNKLIDKIDPGGKNTEGASLGMWKIFYAALDATTGKKQNDPNSWTTTFQKEIDNAKKGVSLFDFDGFIAEAKNQKPLRPTLQLKL